jgi:hypothetical protein
VKLVFDLMRQRIAKSAICAIVSVIVAMVVYTVADLVGNPRMMSHPICLWDLAVGVAILYVVVPVIILVLLTIFRDVPSTGVSIGVAICWLTVIFALWVYKPLAPAARSNSSTPGRVKIPHHCDGEMDDYASA